MQIGISGQVLAEIKTLEEIFILLKELKINAFELWPQNLPVVKSPSFAQNVRYEGRDIGYARQMLDRYGVALAAVSVDGAFDGEMMSDMDEYVASLCYAVEIAAELRCSRVNHYCYNLCLTQEPDIRALLDIWEPAIKKALERNVVLVLENEAHDATRTPEGMLKIVKTIDSDYFRTTYDSCNYYHASQEGYPYAYDLLKDYISYVHLKNGCIFNASASHNVEHKGAPFSGEHCRHDIYYQPLSRGAVNMEGLIARLKADGYEGYCILEPHTTPCNVEAFLKEDIACLIKHNAMKQGA